MVPAPGTKPLYLESEGAARLQVLIWVLQRVNRYEFKPLQNTSLVLVPGANATAFNLADSVLRFARRCASLAANSCLRSHQVGISVIFKQTFIANVLDKCTQNIYFRVGFVSLSFISARYARRICVRFNGPVVGHVSRALRRCGSYSSTLFRTARLGRRSGW